MTILEYISLPLLKGLLQLRALKQETKYNPKSVRMNCYSDICIFK